jgi:hypothetical protein
MLIKCTFDEVLLIKHQRFNDAVSATGIESHAIMVRRVEKGLEGSGNCLFQGTVATIPTFV